MRAWLANRTIALSVSPADDMPQRGLGPEHLNDALGEISRQLFALGARVIYGGDLRIGGVTRMLFELAARYALPFEHRKEQKPMIVDVLAYPTHAELATEELLTWEAEFALIGELQYLGPSEEVWHFNTRPGNLRQLPKEAWPEALTAMRKYVTRSSDARIVLGGKATGYLGRMPGISEEAITSAGASQPLFVIGGFGGAASSIAGEIASANSISVPGTGDVCRVTSGNGLEKSELLRLAQSPHIDEIVVLITRGLRKLFVT